MRVSTGMIFETGVESMQKRTSSLLRTQQQVSSGRRILAPSDDPVAAARVLELAQAKEVNGQYRVAQGYAKSSLGLEEAQLSAAADLIQRVRELAVQSGNGALSAGDRRSIATELRARYEELLAIANSTDGTGHFLFGGFQSAQTPFSGNADTGIAYGGDDGSRTMRISASRNAPVSDSGNDVFMNIGSGNGVFATGSRSTQSSNSGNAVVASSAVIDPALWASSGNPGTFEMRFWVDTANVNGLGANEVFYDFVDPATGKSLITDAASATPYPVSRHYVADTPIAFSGLNIPSGTATPYTSLGATVTIDGTPLNGDTFVVTSTADPAGNGHFTVQPKTAAAGNAGSAIIDRGRVRDDSLWNQAANRGRYEVRFYVDSQGLLGTAGETYYDVVDIASNKSVFTGTGSLRPDQSATLPWTYLAAHKYSSGQAIDLQGLAYPYADLGISVTVSGTPANGDAFTIDRSSSSSVFDTLGTLVAALEAQPSASSTGNTELSNDLAGLLQQLDNVIENFLRVRADIGTRLAEIDDLGSVSEALGIKYEENISALQDVDYAKAITDLTRQQMELEAAQKSFMNISGLSLFNYL